MQNTKLKNPKTFSGNTGSIFSRSILVVSATRQILVSSTLCCSKKMFLLKIIEGTTSTVQIDDSGILSTLNMSLAVLTLQEKMLRTFGALPMLFCAKKSKTIKRANPTAHSCKKKMWSPYVQRRSVEYEHRLNERDT